MASFSPSPQPANEIFCTAVHAVPHTFRIGKCSWWKGKIKSKTAHKIIALGGRHSPFTFPLCDDSTRIWVPTKCWRLGQAGEKQEQRSIWKVPPALGELSGSRGSRSWILVTIFFILFYFKLWWAEGKMNMLAERAINREIRPSPRAWDSPEETARQSLLKAVRIISITVGSYWALTRCQAQP